MTPRPFALILLVMMGLGAPGGVALAEEARDGQASGLLLTVREATDLRERGVQVSAAMVERRPVALGPLYASLAALNAADVYSTHLALAGGAHEANPLMRPVAGRPAGLIAAKAAATAGTIYAVERMWKNGNRTAAVITMIAVNGAMAAVVSHNLRVAQAGR